MIRAVIFDLDGVIVDSEIWWDEVRRDFAAAHGRTWTVDDRHAVMGANSRQWSETIRQRLELPIERQAIEDAIVDGVVARYERDGPPVIDGAVDAVRRIAAGWPTALASSSHRRVIAAIDGRPLPPVADTPARRATGGRSASGASKTVARSGPSKVAATAAAPAKPARTR